MCVCVTKSVIFYTEKCHLNCIPTYDIMIHVIKSISDQTAQDVFDGPNSKASRRLSKELHPKARRLLDALNAAKALMDLRIPPGNHLESLHGKLKGFHSIKINDQWRIIFRWQDGDVYDVEITDYH